LDIFTVLLMFKGSLPPIIAIAAYQAPAFASHFGTLGYLVVSSARSVPKFVELVFCLLISRQSPRSLDFASCHEGSSYRP
jgi:hypothetical protein